MLKYLILLLIYISTISSPSAAGEDLNVSEILDQFTWRMVVPKNDKYSPKVFIADDGKYILKLNDSKLREVYRVEVFEDLAAPKFYSLGDVNDLRTELKAMEKVYCYNCHKSSPEGDFRFLTNYMNKISTDSYRIFVKNENGKAKLKWQRSK